MLDHIVTPDQWSRMSWAARKRLQDREATELAALQAGRAAEREQARARRAAEGVHVRTLAAEIHASLPAEDPEEVARRRAGLPWRLPTSMQPGGGR